MLVYVCACVCVFHFYWFGLSALSTAVLMFALLEMPNAPCIISTHSVAYTDSINTLVHTLKCQVSGVGCCVTFNNKIREQNNFKRKNEATARDTYIYIVYIKREI